MLPSAVGLPRLKWLCLAFDRGFTGDWIGFYIIRVTIIMQTSQSFYDSYRLNTRQRIVSEDFKTISHFEQQIQPWSYQNPRASSRSERCLIGKTAPANLKKIIFFKNRGKECGKDIYKMPRINPSESYESSLLSRRSTAEGEETIHKSRLLISQPFKQMKDKLDLAKLKHPFLFPQMSESQRKEPIKSVCLKLHKFKKIKITQAKSKQKTTDENNTSNQNRNSLKNNFQFSPHKNQRKLEEALLGKASCDFIRKQTTNRRKSMHIHRSSAHDQQQSLKSIFQF